MQPPPDTAPPLPTLFEAQLDERQVAELFADLEHAAQIHEVRVKSGGTARSSAMAINLAALSAQLWSSEHQSVQIIYTHQGRNWIDTLLRGASGVKLVRMQQETRYGAP